MIIEIFFYMKYVSINMHDITLLEQVKLYGW